MNKFDLEFMNGYIKTSLRLARKIKNAKSLEEARRIAMEIEYFPFPHLFFLHVEF